MGAYHANLENMSAFLASDRPKKAAQEDGRFSVNEPAAITRGPRNMMVEAMEHVPV
jgi:hypothetical protein